MEGPQSYLMVALRSFQKPIAIAVIKNKREQTRNSDGNKSGEAAEKERLQFIPSSQKVNGGM